MIEAFKRELDCPAEQLAWYPEEPMSRHTSFRVGGPAELLLSPKSEQAVCSVVRAANKIGAPLTVLGNGSNVLVKDEGLRGVVLCLGADYSAIRTEGTRIEAQTGALLSTLATEACRAGLTGLEFAGGIPGSLGGALFMNAGAYDGQTANVVVSARYYDAQNDTIGVLSNQALAFDYRTSILKSHPEWIALSAVMQLEQGDTEMIRAKMDLFARRRREKQPLNYPSAGSTFKRPAGYFAGKLIQDAGLMGYTVGGAQVSQKHAGFVVNTGGATCADVLAVIAHVQQEVLRQFGVELEPEVRML
ncbi:MAG: UDP-N-acetylmuramate dehydrogenase [Eubacteriales bacterium]|nr:UDP-N-acetylmuramate dehydrogenase [Eubacteriales bacterium]